MRSVARSRVPLASASKRRGSEQISQVQRARMLHSAALVVSEHGYGQMSVTRITGHARVSRRTFYDVFADREDCFLAVFDDTVAQVSRHVIAAYEHECVWHERVRCALTALLGFLDSVPRARSLLIVDALGAGTRVLERRAEILEQLGAVLQQGGSQARSGRELPPLTGEGVVGAVFSVIHTRMLAKRPGPMVELVNPLMGMIVLPYLGAAAAQKELKRRRSTTAEPAGRDGMLGASGSRSKASQPIADVDPSTDPLEGLPMRVTYRTLRVLSAIGETPGASNREVATAAEVVDQGQMSKLLARLEKLGLLHNTGHGQPHGEPNAWRLTTRGEAVQRVVHAPSLDELHIEETGSSDGHPHDRPPRRRHTTIKETR
jgi:AcrR family transcriptional regulator/DNA-binding MarR family transcriptional regulator